MGVRRASYWCAACILWVGALRVYTLYLMSMHLIGVHLMGVHLMGVHLMSVRRAPYGRAIYGREPLTEIINSPSYLRLQFTCRSYLPRVIPLDPPPLLPPSPRELLFS